MSTRTVNFKIKNSCGRIRWITDLMLRIVSVLLSAISTLLPLSTRIRMDKYKLGFHPGTMYYGHGTEKYFCRIFSQLVILSDKLTFFMK